MMHARPTVELKRPWLFLDRVSMFLILGFLISGFNLAAQSPWTQGKAGFLIRASWQAVPEYSTIYDQTFENRQRTLGRRLSEHTLRLYGEYGLTRKTTVLLEIPYRFVRSGTLISASQLSAGSLSSFGNIGFAIRQNFSSKKRTFNGQLRVDLPGGQISPQTGLSTGYDAMSLTALLSFGRHYGHVYWFAYGGGGFRGILDNHYISSGAEAGIRIKKHWLIGFSDLIWNTGSATYFVPLPNRETALFMPDPGFWMLGGKAMLAYNRFFGAQLSAAFPVTGDLVARQGIFTAGLYFKWD